MRKYFSLIKFSHTIFAMPFAFIGFFLAQKEYQFDWFTLIYIILCMIFARSAAMAFNRYIDRDIDLKNIRTATTREIPTGRITPNNALLFVILNSILFILTTYFINTLCFSLSPIALAIILGYSYTKRFTFLCHLILGLGLSLAPIGSYLAVSGEFNIVPILYSLVVLFWVSGFDIIYSLQDEEFDSLNNLNSIPVFFGKKLALILSKILHLSAMIVISYLGYLNDFSNLHTIGSIIFCCLIIFQHSIISSNNLSKINIAFFTTNGIASIIFAIFIILDILTS
jgi:4-hydroxybenzoate polyprenyltransferase|tara:strand:+ start:3502 stop:4350 length:849 start_codon:yes stop_codon:yes gene_type:complete